MEDGAAHTAAVHQVWVLLQDSGVEDFRAVRLLQWAGEDPTSRWVILQLVGHPGQGILVAGVAILLHNREGVTGMAISEIRVKDKQREIKDKHHLLHVNVIVKANVQR